METSYYNRYAVAIAYGLTLSVVASKGVGCLMLLWEAIVRVANFSYNNLDRDVLCYPELVAWDLQSILNFCYRMKLFRSQQQWSMTAGGD